MLCFAHKTLLQLAFVYAQAWFKFEAELSPGKNFSTRFYRAFGNLRILSSPAWAEIFSVCFMAPPGSSSRNSRTRNLLGRSRCFWILCRFRCQFFADWVAQIGSCELETLALRFSLWTVFGKCSLLVRGTLIFWALLHLQCLPRSWNGRYFLIFPSACSLWSLLKNTGVCHQSRFCY